MFKINNEDTRATPSIIPENVRQLLIHSDSFSLPCQFTTECHIIDD